MLHVLCLALFEHLSRGVTAHSRTEAQAQLPDSLVPEQQSQPLMDPAVKSSRLKNTFDACTCHKPNEHHCGHGSTVPEGRGVEGSEVVDLSAALPNVLTTLNLGSGHSQG